MASRGEHQAQPGLRQNTLASPGLCLLLRFQQETPDLLLALSRMLHLRADPVGEPMVAVDIGAISDEGIRHGAAAGGEAQPYCLTECVLAGTW
eukprot:1004076-Rhodomonas_salina.4